MSCNRLLRTMPFVHANRVPLLCRNNPRDNSRARGRARVRVKPPCQKRKNHHNSRYILELLDLTRNLTCLFCQILSNTLTVLTVLTLLTDLTYLTLLTLTAR